MRVAAFCAVAASLVGLLFGLAPAWHASGTALVQAIAAESRSTTTRGGPLRSLLVVGEIAAAVLLLCGAGLLLHALIAVENVDAGYRADNVLTMRANLEYGLPTSRFGNEDALRKFFRAVEDEVQAIPESTAWRGRASCRSTARRSVASGSRSWATSRRRKPNGRWSTTRS